MRIGHQNLRLAPERRGADLRARGQVGEDLTDRPLDRRREGDVVWWYLALYGVARFLNEFLRNDQAAVASGLTTAQLVCIAFVIVGGTMLLKSWTREPDPLPDVSP